MMVEPCQSCENRDGEDRAIVPYVPEPNEALVETEWGQGMPTLHSAVCTACGHVIYVFDTNEPARAGDVQRSGQFRVDEELR